MPQLIAAVVVIGPTVVVAVIRSKAEPAGEAVMMLEVIVHSMPGIHVNARHASPHGLAGARGSRLAGARMRRRHARGDACGQAAMPGEAIMPEATGEPTDMAGEAPGTEAVAAETAAAGNGVAAAEANVTTSTEAATAETVATGTEAAATETVTAGTEAAAAEATMAAANEATAVATTTTTAAATTARLSIGDEQSTCERDGRQDRDRPAHDLIPSSRGHNPGRPYLK
jgi:hypothetical protein